MRSYIALVAQVSPCVSFHVIHACALVLVARVFSLHPSLYFFLKSFFHLFLMFTLVPDENSMEDPLCNSSFGSMVSLDYGTPDTFFLPVDPRNESHGDPDYIDFSVPRFARYMHNAWKRHQDVVFWVDIRLRIKKGLVFYQTKSNAIILQGTFPAHCISRVERLENGE